MEKKEREKIKWKREIGGREGKKGSPSTFFLPTFFSPSMAVLKRMELTIVDTIKRVNVKFP